MSIIAGFLPLKAQLALIPYEDGVYKIYSPEHLNYLSIATQNGETTEGKTFYLMNDIDMANINNYIPIIFSSGNFNGNNHKIANLTIISDEFFSSCGVFATINNSTIENIIVENGNFAGITKHVGGLVGYANNSIIKNSHTKNGYCEFPKAQPFGGIMGGLIAYAQKCTIINCSSSSTLMTYAEGFNDISGLIGKSFQCKVFESYSKGDIFSYSNAYPEENGTSICGFLYSQRPSYIKNCYSHVNIVSYHQNAPIAGFAILTVGDTIINCYAMPRVFEIYNNQNSVGLFCRNSKSSFINNCFYTSEISGYDGDPSYTIPLLFNKSEAEMNSPVMVSFPGALGSSLNFDLDNPVWVQDLSPFQNNGLPMLRWQQDVNVEENKIENRINVYPNPTTGELRVESGELRVENVEVFDIYGRKHEGTKARKDESTKEINISGLPAGIYFIKISTENGIFVEKIIKN